MPFTEGSVRSWQIWLTHLGQEDELRWRAEGCPARDAPEAGKAKPRELAAIGLPPVTSHGRGLRDSPDCLERQNRPRGQTAVTPIGIVMSEVILLFAFYNVSIVYCLISLLHKVSPNNTLYPLSSDIISTLERYFKPTSSREGNDNQQRK